MKPGRRDGKGGLSARSAGPKVVSERLGHGSIGITLDTYSHVGEGLQEEAASRVASLIFGIDSASPKGKR